MSIDSSCLLQAQAAPSTRAARQAVVPSDREAFAWRAAGLLSAFGLFLFARPYRGIVNDALIYVGRAMADADPDGLGRDLLFGHDGQSRFSVFPPLLRSAVEALGPSTAALGLTAFALALWFTGAAVFTSRVATGRLAWAALVFVAVLVPSYGDRDVFSYAEALAIPRPFAEAATLGGLAALAAGRTGLSLAILLCAALLHPIMAAPGLAVWGAVLVRRDRRWLAPLAVALALIVAAALAGLPLVDRLAVRMDPEWREAADVAPFLFPTAWNSASWARLLVHLATLAVALPFVPDLRARRVLAAIGGVGLVGVAVSLALGDLWPGLLAIQTQPWRALWLVAVAAAATLPVATAGLWRLGRSGQVAAAGLAFAWLGSDSLSTAAIGLGVAAAFLLAGRGRPNLVSRPIVVAGWSVLAALALAWWIHRIAFVAEVWSARPGPVSIRLELWRLAIPTLPVAIIAMIVGLNARRRPGAAVPVALACGLALLAVATWDDRSPVQDRLDRWSPDPALTRLLPPGSGDVLWLRGDNWKAWVWAGRRNWASGFQGSSMIFSRDLAVEWQKRMRLLESLGVADESDRAPFLTDTRPPIRPSRDAIASLCRVPGGPEALIVQANDLFSLPAGLETTAWRAPEPQYRALAGAGALAWTTYQDATVIDCRQFGAAASGG